MMFSTVRPIVDQQIETGERRGAGAGGDELHILELLADELQPIEHRGADDDRGAVLVVMEDRNLHPRAELLLDRRSIPAP